MRARIEAVFREERGGILASLIRRSGGDWEAAEAALSDALAAALECWGADGLPSNPGAWVTRVAHRRLVDTARGARRRTDLAADLALEPPTEGASAVTADEDPRLAGDPLRLIFTCCHPALNGDAQVALTLNAVCGLRAADIARVFLVREVTLSQRIVRAKHKIQASGIPFEIPGPELLTERLPVVLRVVYLVFNEGYVATRGDELVRVDLAQEATRLTRLLAELLPAEPEVRGLLALMLLQHARRNARVSLEGELVLLEDQDRSLWDRTAIEEGTRVLEGALAERNAGPYQVQAAIAAVHGESPSGPETDWLQIALLYDRLLALQPSPVHELNRAVAVAMTGNVPCALESVEALATAGELDDYLYLHATRADFLRRLERRGEAREAYRRALDLADNAVERRFLTRRLSEVDG